MADWNDSVESHEVDTLRAQIAKLKIELEQLLGQLLVAEQQRDAAHAALETARTALTDCHIAVTDIVAAALKASKPAPAQETERGR